MVEQGATIDESTLTSEQAEVLEELRTSARWEFFPALGESGRGAPGEGEACRRNVWAVIPDPEKVEDVAAWVDNAVAQLSSVLAEQKGAKNPAEPICRGGKKVGFMVAADMPEFLGVDTSKPFADRVHSRPMGGLGGEYQELFGR